MGHANAGCIGNGITDGASGGTIEVSTYTSYAIGMQRIWDLEDFGVNERQPEQTGIR